MTTEYDVLLSQGNELTLSGDGKIIKRNVAHVKKLYGDSSSPKPSPDDQTEESGPASPDPRTSSMVLPPQLPPLKLVKEGGMWRPADTPAEHETQNT